MSGNSGAPTVWPARLSLSTAFARDMFASVDSEHAVALRKVKKLTVEGRFEVIESGSLPGTATYAVLRSQKEKDATPFGCYVFYYANPDAEAIIGGLKKETVLTRLEFLELPRSRQWALVKIQSAKGDEQISGDGIVFELEGYKYRIPLTPEQLVALVNAPVELRYLYKSKDRSRVAFINQNNEMIILEYTVSEDKKSVQPSAFFRKHCLTHQQSQVHQTLSTKPAAAWRPNPYQWWCHPTISSVGPIQEEREER